jgi:hypothetical protein
MTAVGSILEDQMKLKVASLFFLGIVVNLVAESSLAAEKILVCATLGHSNSGKVLGLRVFEDGDKKLTATIDEVTMFHSVVVAFNPTSLRSLEVKKIFNHMWDHYRGDGFDLEVLDFGFPTQPHKIIGQVLLNLNGIHADVLVEMAEDYDNSGYCR